MTALVCVLAVLSAAILIFDGDRLVLLILAAGIMVGLAYLCFPRRVDRWLGAVEARILDFELVFYPLAVILALIIGAVAFI